MVQWVDDDAWIALMAEGRFNVVLDEPVPCDIFGAHWIVPVLIPALSIRASILADGPDADAALSYAGRYISAHYERIMADAVQRRLLLNSN